MENEQNKKEPILSVKNLRVSFKTDEGLVHAVRGVSFDLYKEETLCIVGESGSGKSVTSKTIMGILSANAVIEEGSVMYEGEDLTKVDESEFHRIRGHKIGMVFQDPLSSLNPIMKVGKQITEAMLVNSNRLKTLRDHLISKEEAAYKNAEAKKKSEFAKADREVELSDEKYDKEIYAYQRKAKELSYDLSLKEAALRPLLKEKAAFEHAAINHEVQLSDEKFDKEISVYQRKEKELSDNLSLKKSALRSLPKEKAAEREKATHERDEAAKALSAYSKTAKKEIAKLKKEKAKEHKRIVALYAPSEKKTASKKTAQTEKPKVTIILPADLAAKVEKATKERDEAVKAFSSFNEKAGKEVAQLKQEKEKEHRRLTSLGKDRKKKAVEEYKATAPALKKALDAKKKEADVEIQKYKAEKKKEYEAKVAELSQGKISEEEYASKVASENVNYQNALEELTKKQSEEALQLEQDFNSQTDQLQKNRASAKDLSDAKKSYLDDLEASEKKMAKEKEKLQKDHEEKLAEYKEAHTHEKALAKAKEEYKANFKITHAEAKAAALKVMKEVGIPQPEVRFNQYPFEFSGGMRQRIVIAIALTANPEILICDEPTTALDVTIQAQILELINRLKKERHMSIIFISHDLGVVANMADRVAVMYAGKIVEVGTAAEIFYDPRHPYTWALLSSIPDIDSHEKLEAIPGTPPYLLNPPKGDAFAARNKYALAIDFEEEPPFFKVSETHYAATWLLDKRAPKTVMPKIVSQRIKSSLERAGVKHD